jgi:hypothetical protein
MSRAALALAALVSLSAWADSPTGRDINPGVLGPNAIPVRAGESARVAPVFDAKVELAGQWSTPEGGGNDYSAEPWFRFAVPVGRHVSLAFDGAPFEFWQYSAETNALWQPKRSKGMCRADVSVVTKVWFLEQQGFLPDAAVRVSLKTATGEDLHTRRYLDAPAYQFDLLASWTHAVGDWVLEGWLLGGFLSWQQGQSGQNDALYGDATFVARLAALSLLAELRGYRGWEGHDRPAIAMVGAEAALTPRWSLTLSVARTFVDPPTLDVRLGVRFQLPAGPLLSW